VRSLDYSEQLKTLLVGTRGSEILEIDAEAGRLKKVLVRGHYEGAPQAELWGCAVHPKEQLFASCGADFTVRVWTVDKMVKCSAPFKTDLTAVDWSSDGQFLVVGDRNGYIYSVNASTLKQLG